MCYKKVFLHYYNKVSGTRKEMIINHHINKLLNLSPIYKSSDISKLQKLHGIEINAAKEENKYAFQVLHLEGEFLCMET